MVNQQITLPGVGDLLKRSWQIYIERFWVFLGIVILPWLVILPFGLILGGLYLAGLTKFLQLLPVFLIAILIFAFIVIIVIIWSRVALLYAIKERDLKIGIKESFRKGWPKIISFFWTSLLVGFITLIGLLLFVIPGIIFAVWFSLATYVLVAEDLRGIRALSRSKNLISGKWWKVFWRFLVLGLIFGILGIGINFLISYIDIFYIGDVLPGIISIFLIPFVTTYIFLIYEDLKKLKEKPDIPISV